MRRPRATAVPGNEPPVEPPSVCFVTENPRATALYQCAARHAPELKAGGRFGRHVEENVIARFLECGDLQHGFARIYCGQCRYAFILAFSCKARYFCPSCHQKRVLAYGE